MVGVEEREVSGAFDGFLSAVGFWFGIGGSVFFCRFKKKLNRTLSVDVGG